MSMDHMILTAVWTAYIYAGGYLKDRRLVHYIGEPYREYARRVPGFPVIGLGLLGRMA
jgi:methanethiol S-methyltransferase